MRIALGVSGGIAAYKAAEILRLLQDRGVKAQVIMTRAAQEFVRPLPFAALSGEKVITEMFAREAGEPNVESAIEHIAVAERIEALLVAPATADILAKFAHGIADDFLSTLFLATRAPVIVAPAMNVNMWSNPATQENLATLRSRGVRVVAPGDGYLACGMVGPGRLAENESIVAATLAALGASQDFAGQTVLITAGPTREAIDPVRYISNRSSGKMGYALAQAAVRRGARVVLVSGPTSQKAPDGAELFQVESAAEMHQVVMERAPEADIIIKAAAVADYRPKKSSVQKLKRHDFLREGVQGYAQLDLEPTPDIAAELGARKQDQTVVGFAAETENVLENARKKLVSKGLDAIVANDVSQPGIGMDSDRNAVTIITAAEVVDVPEAPKTEIAQRILDVILRLRCKPLKIAD
jgi:phosphopantothenoylcysteine decarboxylase / phosphopantothenate---cysteine ligase